MRDRAFGVEIECGYNGNGGNRHECNCSECGYYDEYYDEPRGVTEAINLLYDNGLRDWANGDIHEDGSGVEIPSPVLRGQKGLNELQRVMALLKANSFYVGSEDGLHVHHDAPEFMDDPDLLVGLVEAWNDNQEVISTFVAPSRRRNHWACPTWTSTQVTYLKETVERTKRGEPGVDEWGYAQPAGPRAAFRTGPRGALNLHSLLEHGSIEIRQHEGTLEFDEAYAWIHFGQAFLDSVLKKRVIRCSSSAQLLNTIGVSQKSKETLLVKAAA